MKRFIRQIAIALVAAAVLAAGCTDGPAEVTTTQPTVARSSTTAAPTTEVAQSSEPKVIGLEAVEAALDELGQAGFSGVVLVDDGTRTIHHAVGMADREESIPIREDTVFDIGSVTKQFTGAAILRLQMDGLLTVDDRIGDYVDGLTAEQADVTLHQLLTHSGGMPDALGPDDEPIELAEFVTRIAATPLLAEPGTFYEYSNVGYSLLAAAIEQVTGGSYESYLQTALFEPAGMAETGYVLPTWTEDQVAVGYNPETGRRIGRPPELVWADDGPYWHLRGNGGILSTAGDMLRWHQALLGDEVLDAESKAALYGQHIEEGEGAGTYYGYGWAIFPAEGGGGDLITHNGGNGIFFADFLRFIDDGLTVFIATNSGRFEDETIAFELAGLALGQELIDAVVDDVSCPLPDFVGFTPDALPPAILSPSYPTRSRQRLFRSSLMFSTTEPKNSAWPSPPIMSVHSWTTAPQPPSPPSLPRCNKSSPATHRPPPSVRAIIEFISS